jgi:hypothetical protein
MSSPLRGAVAAVLLAAASSVARAQVPLGKQTGTPAPQPGVEAPKSLEVPPGQVVVAGKSPNLILLYTGDVIGFVDPCG